MNFFDPHIKLENGNWYKQERYREILKEQVTISYISKSISIADTDLLSPFDREIVFETLKEIKQAESDAQKDNNSNMRENTSRYGK